MADSLLRVEGLESGYGALPVLHGVDLAVAPGQVAVVLGLNGAGKSTTVKVLSGVLPAWSGTVVYRGEPIDGRSISDRVRSGIAMVPEGRRVFADLTVSENLGVGSWVRRRDTAAIGAERDRVLAWFPRLGERLDQLAGSLSGGEQQMLAIGRALMSGPDLLIIDEASLGLSPAIAARMFEVVASVAAAGTAVVLVEQNSGALAVADVGYFMRQGAIVAELRGDDLDDTERLRQLYLG